MIVTATGMSVLSNSTGNTSVDSLTVTSSLNVSDGLTPGKHSNLNTSLSSMLPDELLVAEHGDLSILGVRLERKGPSTTNLIK